MTTLARIGAKQSVEITETIALNDTNQALEKARFDHQTKILALQQEFNARRDSLRKDYHEIVAGIAGEE